MGQSSKLVEQADRLETGAGADKAGHIEFLLWDNSVLLLGLSINLISLTHIIKDHLFYLKSTDHRY